MNERMRLRSFYLEDQMYETLRGIAQRSDYNISQHVRAALQQYVVNALLDEQSAVVAASVAPVESFTSSPTFPIELEAAGE